MSEPNEEFLRVFFMESDMEESPCSVIAAYFPCLA
jgi:hypothetical protein